MAKRKADIEEQLRQAVLESGVSLARLAELSGVDKGILSRFVRGERSMTLPTAARLAKVLGLKLRPTERQRKGG